MRLILFLISIIIFVGVVSTSLAEQKLTFKLEKPLSQTDQPDTAKVVDRTLLAKIINPNASSSTSNEASNQDNNGVSNQNNNGGSNQFPVGSNIVQQFIPIPNQFPSPQDIPVPTQYFH